jgi:uncharacterized protein (UPF0276 family)
MMDARSVEGSVGLGLGIGWRPQLAVAIDRIPDLGFVELTAENFPDPGRVPGHVRQLTERGVRAVVHGVGLSLGGAEPVAPARARHLAELARAVRAPLVSEHIAFVRAGGREAGHLLPIPRTRAALGVLCGNVRVAREHLDGVPLVLENISALFDWPADQRQMSEADFLCEVVERTGAGLLLDVANVYANCHNLGGDPVAFLEKLPLDRVAYVHMGGGVEKEGVYHDTHAHAVPQGAIALLEELAARTDVPGVMLERDDNFPDEAELTAEMDRIRGALARGAARRARAVSGGGA